MRFVALGHQQGVPWANVLWVKNGGASAPDQSTLDAFCTFLSNAFATAWQAGAEVACSYDSGEVTYFLPGSEALRSTALEGLNGSHSGGGLTNATSLCISWPIAAMYRGGHPRTYLAGIPDSATVSGHTFDTSYLTACTGRFATFRSSVNGHTAGALTSLQLGTVSFVHNKAWRTPPVFRAFVGAPTADTRIDTQRRRLGPDR